jgi:16S rRNA (guanine527-N7)-methyltransferase
VKNVHCRKIQTNMPDLWEDLTQRAGLALSAEQWAQLGRYLDLLEAGGGRMNLTRITDRPAAELLHVADSLTVLPFLPARKISLADVGTGGGVPGIILAIARPDARVTLIESTGKKCRFLEETIATLGLANASVLQGRAEDLAEMGGENGQRERFDVVVARAVATLAWLAEWCLPLAKMGGTVLAMKGPKAVEELPEAMNAIRLLGGGEPTIEPAHLPGAEGHLIVRIPKRAPTPTRYPRGSTMTGGKPIL